MTDVIWGGRANPNLVCSFDSFSDLWLDTNQSSSTNGLLLSVSVGSGYSESYSYDSLKRVQLVMIDGRNYTTSFQFDAADQVTQITYPSNRVINIGHDSKGRVASVS